MGTSNQPQQPGEGTGGHRPTEPIPGPQWYGAPGSGQAQDPRRGAFGAPNAATHRPPPYDGGPQGPYGSQSQHGPQGAPPGGPGRPEGPVAPTAPAAKRPRRRYELPAVALLAALLASGATYGVGQLGDHGATAANAGTSSSQVAAPVIQATGSSPDWTATAKAVSPSVVAIKVTNGQSGGQGSGVIIDALGHVVTNNHVATAGGSNATITVTLKDNRTYQATVVGTDPSTDLAVLQITDPPGDLSPISMGDSSKLSVGEPVMAVGNPLGLAGTVTTGIVSALDRPVTTQGESSGLGQSSQPVVTNAIQTSAAINPGNSGGALVNDSGQLIGINSSIATLGSGMGGGQSGNIGIGFAIPVNEVTSIADQLITNGKAEHAYLGVAGEDTTVQLGSARRSASKIRVLADTPAAKAGLKTGDAVIAINGDSVDSWLSLVAQVHERTPGDKATVAVVRDGQRHDISVTFGTAK